MIPVVTEEINDTKDRKIGTPIWSMILLMLGAMALFWDVFAILSMAFSLTTLRMDIPSLIWAFAVGVALIALGQTLDYAHEIVIRMRRMQGEKGA